jgi:phosphomannomutase
MMDVLSLGENRLLEPIGNHCRGTKFVNANHLINNQLDEVFSKISEGFEGFYYGRFDMKVESIDDLATPTDGLPPTDGLRLWLSGGVRIIIRPSGTEAKLKCYIEVISPNQQSAEKELNSLRAPLKAFLGA